MKQNFYISKPTLESFIEQATAGQTPGDIKNVYVGISTRTVNGHFYIIIDVACWVIDEVYVPMICRFETDTVYQRSEHQAELKKARSVADTIKNKIQSAGFNVFEGYICPSPISINLSTQTEI